MIVKTGLNRYDKGPLAMRCNSVLASYEDYTRGTLGSKVLARIENHLAECHGCREEFELNDRMAALMREGSEVAHPGVDYFENLNERVLAGLSRDRPAGPLADATGGLSHHAWWRQPIWWTGAMTACGLLALGLVGESTVASGGVGRLVASAPTALPSPNIASPPAGEGSAAADAPSVAPMASIPPAPVAPATGPTVVVSADSTKRELVIGPGLQPSALSSESMAEVAAMTPASGKSFDKSSSRDTERKTTIQPVAIKRAAEPAGDLAAKLADELAEQLETIRTQMTERGDRALADGLRDLVRRIDERTARDATLESLPGVRQVRLFAEAQDALAEGRPREVWTRHRRILMIDADSPLAQRARLQLADLYYNEWADFQAAQRYYQECRGPAAERAFTTRELDHVARQTERLRTHAGNNWQSLGLLHVVRRGEWPETESALRELTVLDGAADLLPEAARTVVERMQTSEETPMETAISIYKLLDARAAAETNPNLRAWLELALGDMQLAQFQELQGAINHFNRAIEIAGDGGAGRLAASKRDQLIDRQLLELVR
jgi:tetratricopeptide (TPR) repeat protein